MVHHDHALRHGDRIVTIDYCDGTSPYLYESQGPDLQKQS